MMKHRHTKKSNPEKDQRPNDDTLERDFVRTDFDFLDIQDLIQKRGTCGDEGLLGLLDLLIWSINGVYQFVRSLDKVYFNSVIKQKYTLHKKVVRMIL